MVPSVYSYIDPMTQERQTVSMRCAKVTDISRLAWRSTTKNYMLPIDKAGYDALATVAPPREGGDGMLYLSLARGRTLNCVYDGDLAPWDIAAPAAVVLGAGGVITDAQGQPLNFMRDGKTTVVAAATPALHAAVLGIIQQGAQNVGL
jgi:fructose-1,6-bisphosphatase/inositol monophosphatase family enzyme